MEESFELQSSMSPKVKGHQKHYRKGATLLSLKKNIRRSSIYDKSNHTTNNADLIIIEDSNSTDSSPSSNMQIKMINGSAIIISDTDYSENENDSIAASAKEEKFCIKTSRETSENSCLLSQGKLHDIKRWIDIVNVETEIKPNITTYSDVSTIYADTLDTNFKPEGIGRAANSTFVGPDCVRFDKLFKTNENVKTDSPPVAAINDNSADYDQPFSDIIIDDSFKDLDESLNTRVRKKLVTKLKSGSNGVELDYSKDLIKSDGDLSMGLQTDMSKTPDKEVLLQNNIDCAGSNIETVEERSHLVSMLDDLYGNSWRDNEEHVLPKTEPRKKLPKPILHMANTERKPKFSVLYKNPYVESEKIKSNNLLKNLQRSRMQMNIESPWSKRLKDLCDSDTPSEDSKKITEFRKKLDFDNDSDSEEDNDKLNKPRRTSEYFQRKIDTGYEVPFENESNKENSDKEFPCSGKTREERIRCNTPKDKNKVQIKQPVTRKKPLKEKGTARYKNGLTENAGSSSRSNSRKSSETKVSKEFTNISSPSVSSDEEWEREVSKIVRRSDIVNGQYSFLASLSANIPIHQCDMSARIYRNNFKNYKEQLLEKLFDLYNQEIFDDSIPKDTEFEWNDRLRGTAGYCSCKKITRRTGDVERKVKIVLSTKVIDAAYRLRDTLVHELCHAATWIVNCVSDGHGSYWKAWAYKAMKTFPELPPIKRCHDYVINTKYTYRCTGCGYSIGRHSKSLDIERKCCGYCRGKFEILINKISKKGETKSVPATPKREATGFALFVKENYGVYKNAQLKHGDIMKLLGQKFQELKVK